MEVDVPKVRIDVTKLTINQMMILYYFCINNVVTATGASIGEWLGSGKKLTATAGLKKGKPPILYSLGKTSIRKPTHRTFNVWKFNHEYYDFQMLKVDLHNTLVELKKGGALDRY